MTNNQNPGRDLPASNLHTIRTKFGYMHVIAKKEHILAACGFSYNIENIVPLSQELLNRLTENGILTDSTPAAFLCFPGVDVECVKLVRTGEYSGHFYPADPEEVQELIDTLGNDWPGKEVGA